MPKKHQIVYYTPAIGWGVFIFVMSLLPSSELPNVLITTDDLIIHGGVYGVYGLLLSWALHKSDTYSFKARVGIWTFATLFGVLVEIAQATLTQYRQFEFLDMLANSTGALLAISIFHLIYKRVV